MDSAHHINAVVNHIRTIFLIAGEKPYMETASIFPQGYEDENFQVYLLVRVDDFIGSFSDLELSVTVSFIFFTEER